MCNWSYRTRKSKPSGTAPCDEIQFLIAGIFADQFLCSTSIAKSCKIIGLYLALLQAFFPCQAMALPAGGGASGKRRKPSMKAKKVSKVAKGRFAKALVLRGSKEKTVGGLTAAFLMKNKRGKVVSKKASANGKRRYHQIENWVESVMEARSALHIEGFVAINGKSLKGKALYVKARAIRATKSCKATVPTIFAESAERS